MFKIGDVVVYSTTGVCEISDICNKSFGGETSQYYILTPILQKASTVFVPVNNPLLTKKIHPILSRGEFEAIFSGLKNKKPVRPESEQERREKFSEILESGDREGLILMVYDLSLYKNEQTEKARRLHLSDERLYNSAKSLLFEEISYIFNLDMELVPEFLDSRFK